MNKQKPPPNIVNFGCRLNIAEGAVIEKLWHHHNGFDNEPIIINSCAVTNETERQVQQKIRQYHKKYPHKNIIVTGCAGQIQPDKYSNMPEVSKVIGNHEKFLASSYTSTQTVQVGDIMKRPLTNKNLHGVYKEQTRAFIEVQNGCNHRCTFCIIPYGRGNSYAEPSEKIIETIQHLLDENFKEIILSGVDLTSWQEHIQGKTHYLGYLVQQILHHIPQLPRLRLSSIDVAEVDPLLLKMIANEERLMPHIHLSLQAGDDMILKRMKRRHTRSQAIELVEHLRSIRPDISIGGDLIGGFPTEDDAMFDHTLQMLRIMGLEHAHIFPFSAKIGTPASKIPHQVPIAIRKKRCKILREQQQIIRDTWLQKFIGTTQQILIEKHQKAYTNHYAPVYIEGKGCEQVNVMANVTITKYENNQLYATML